MRQSSSIQKHGDILAWLYSLAKNRRGQTDRQTDNQRRRSILIRVTRALDFAELNGKYDQGEEMKICV